MSEVTLKQVYIDNYYIELSISTRYGETVFQVSRSYGFGPGTEYKEDKYQVYGDLKRATAAYNRYKREVAR